MCANSPSFSMVWWWTATIQPLPSLQKSIFFYFSSLLKALSALSSQRFYWLITQDSNCPESPTLRKMPYNEKRKQNIFIFLLIAVKKALVWNERLKQQLFIGYAIKHYQLAVLWALNWHFKGLVYSQEALSQALPVLFWTQRQTTFTTLKKWKCILNVS